MVIEAAKVTLQFSHTSCQRRRSGWHFLVLTFKPRVLPLEEAFDCSTVVSVFQGKILGQQIQLVEFLMSNYIKVNVVTSFLRLSEGQL